MRVEVKIYAKFYNLKKHTWYIFSGVRGRISQNDFIKIQVSVTVAYQSTRDVNTTESTLDHHPELIAKAHIKIVSNLLSTMHVALVQTQNR